MIGLCVVCCVLCVAVAVPIVRTVSVWVPDRLLCKRWNVPDPYAGLGAEPQGQRRSRFERDSVADLVGLPAGMLLQASELPPHAHAQAPGPYGVPPVPPTSDRGAPLEAVPEPPRPAVDFFRAIFEPSDDDDDGDGNGDDDA